MGLYCILEKASTANVFAGSLILILAYIASTAIYRLYFHPLSSYPGPFWARLTVIPSYWHTLQRDRHIWLWRLQEEYGPTFRYRPDSVLVNTPTAYRSLFGPKGNVKKGVYYEVWPRNVDAVTTWSSVDLNVHSRKRRVLNQSFSAEALKSAEPLVLANTKRWCELIALENNQAGWSQSLNMAEWVNYLVFDILGDLCFGKCFDMKEPDSGLRFVPHLMAEFLVLMHPIAYSPFAELWAWLKPRGLDQILTFISPPAVKNWQAFVEECLAKRTQAENSGNLKGRKDFFHYLFHAVDPETGKRGFPLEELYGEAEALIIAGADTTAIIISAMFFYLARNPTIQAKVASEILATFSSSDEITTGPKLGSCTYLRAFIQEALRMTPAVSAEPSRRVMKGGTHVDGRYFPEGVNVSVGLYCLSYSKDIFQDPFTFKPERWIVGQDGSTKESVELAEAGFCSFSYGSRGCPGKQLAWMEMTIVMAKVLFDFEIRPDFMNDLGAGSMNAKVGRRAAGQYQTYDAFHFYDVAGNNFQICTDKIRSCEDALLIESAGVALLPCDPGRERWNSVMGFFVPGPVPRGELYAYDYKNSGAPDSESLKRFDFVDYAPGEDFHSLGMGYNGDSSTLLVANNRHDGPAVDIFKLDFEALTATHVRSIKHPLIHGPNAIVVRNSKEFFVTNDHFFLMAKSRLLSQAETYLGLPLGTVVHVDISDATMVTANVVARVPFANGIELLNETTLAVASTSSGSVKLFTVTNDAEPGSTPKLLYHSRIALPFNVDNLSLSSDGRLIMAGHPHPPSLVKFAATRYICNDPAEFAAADQATQEYCRTGKTCSWVSEWSETDGLRHLYADTDYPSSATAALDAERKVGIIAGLYAKGILVWRE
ncbi:hypothetical protein JX266_011618 [Neoarthrinium moseri]|nr:hypothetical protein JX266_011618 [Neoarthrinium moseri]